MNVQRAERSVVIGAGVAGLMAAVVLSERFDEVVIEPPRVSGREKLSKDTDHEQETLHPDLPCRTA